MPGDSGVQLVPGGSIGELILGICAGILLAQAVAMLHTPRVSARWTGFAFFFSSACFAVKLWCDLTNALPVPIYTVINLIAWTSASWFWMMTMALFDDVDAFSPWMFAAPAGQLLLGLSHKLPLEALQPVFWISSTVLQVLLAVLALMVIMRGWKDDLVEQRRRVRRPILTAVALYIVSLNGFDVWEMIGDTPDWYPIFNTVVLLAVTLAGAFVFIEVRAALVGRPAPASAPAPPARHAANGNGSSPPEASRPAGMDRAAKADLDRLNALMRTQQVWREEGLTISSLAVKAGIPEAQLRRLINDQLGYRNFPSFVNAHRIGAAKTRLADPNEARVTVSTIAYDIGFASLGPFNRAFREETGVSPSEWRRKSLSDASPIPEEA